jgi:hypothetical protein
VFEAGGARKADKTINGSIGDSNNNNNKVFTEDHNGFSGYFISLIILKISILSYFSTLIYFPHELTIIVMY